MVLKFDIEEPEERKKFIDSEAEREPPREANCCDVIAVVSGVLICALIIFGLASLISFIASLNEIEQEPVIQPQYDCGPGDPVEWCPPPASGNSSNSNNSNNSTYTPPASGNSSNSTNSSNLTNSTVYNQTIDGNITEYNQTIDNSSNLTEFD